MADNLIKATDQTFAQLIAGDKPVLVDFWAEWCGPCRMVAPFLEEISTEYADKITVAKLNVDENPQTALQYEVMSIPTMIVFRAGLPTSTRIVGARPKHALLTDLASYLA
jgi:thioredoxin 1